MIDCFCNASGPEQCTRLCSGQVCLSVFCFYGVMFNDTDGVEDRVSKQYKATWRPVKMVQWVLLIIPVTYAVFLSNWVQDKFQTMFQCCLDGDSILWQCVGKGAKISMPNWVSYFNHCQLKLEPISIRDCSHLSQE